MLNLNPLRVVLLCFLSSFAITSAAPLTVSVSGVFSNSVSSTTLAAPGATWAFNFNLDSSPSVSNVLGASFDVAFSGFSYSLAGKTVNAAPQSIRFYNVANNGLFTLFFGPESGFMNGVPIPEFEFDGPQAYTGAATAPLITTGKFPVSEWIYSDSVNFDDRLPAANTVTIAASTATPEPATGLLLLLPLVGLALRRRS